MKPDRMNKQNTELRADMYNRAWTRENLSSGVANNTGADQPAHPRSLISVFVVRLMAMFLLLHRIQSFLSYDGVPYHGDFINIKPVHIVKIFFYILCIS